MNKKTVESITCDVCRRSAVDEKDAESFTMIIESGDTLCDDCHYEQKLRWDEEGKKHY